jgi:hypothetical protein
MKKIFLIINILVLSSCAPSIISSSARVVVINNSQSMNAVETQAMADAHCQKYNRHAIHRPDNIRDGLATYECID